MGTDHGCNNGDKPIPRCALPRNNKVIGADAFKCTHFLLRANMIGGHHHIASAIQKEITGHDTVRDDHMGRLDKGINRLNLSP